MYQSAPGVLFIDVASRRRSEPGSRGRRRRIASFMGDAMPVQSAGPHLPGGAPGAVQHTVLLTGASGVVGRALLQRLRGLDVVCLVHRSPVSGPNVTTAPGDIAKPGLGLAEEAYAELAAKVDA